MYHYTESGLSNVYLKNGFTVEEVDGESYSSIDDIDGLHQAIAEIVVVRTHALYIKKLPRRY